MKSIMQENKECFVCKTTLGLELHHCFFGSANRKLSDVDGCTVYLCRDHHTGPYGVHCNRQLDLSIKRQCQTAWQEQYQKSVDDFIARYGKSYL